MKRISTDKEYLESGKVVIDADGIVIDLGDLLARLEAAEKKITALEAT